MDRKSLNPAPKHSGNVVQLLLHRLLIISLTNITTKTKKLDRKYQYNIPKTHKEGI